MEINAHHRQEFAHAFLVCAEWSSTWTENSDTEPVELDSLELEWAPEAIEKARVFCDSFIDANRDLLSDERIDAGQAGHDLWLTAHGHGAGFWDRGHGELGLALTKAAKQAGCFDHCYPHNGQLHFES